MEFPLGFRDDALRTFSPIFCFAIAGTDQDGSYSFLVCVIPDILIVALLTPFLPDQSWRVVVAAEVVSVRVPSDTVFPVFYHQLFFAVRDGYCLVNG